MPDPQVNHRFFGLERQRRFGFRIKGERMGIVESMRQEWDARARKDAFYYIASWRKHWNVADFMKSGEEDYQRFVAPVFERCSFSPSGKKMLELGCGTGRMTHCFATYFDHVTAVDVSAQMLARAQEMLPSVRNISWAQANGVDLREVGSQSVDFVFSYLVLQHLPNENVACAYVGEMLRVLRLSGICIFQFNGANVPTMNWKGRLGWGCVDALWMIHLPEVSRFVARRLGFDPEMAGRTWRGIALTTQTVVDTVNASGGSILEMQGENTPTAWCCARKVRISDKNQSEVVDGTLG